MGREHKTSSKMLERNQQITNSDMLERNQQITNSEMLERNQQITSSQMLVGREHRTSRSSHMQTVNIRKGHSGEICTVAGLAGSGSSSRKLIGLSRTNGRARQGLRGTWAAGVSIAEKAKRYTRATCTQPHTVRVFT